MTVLDSTVKTTSACACLEVMIIFIHLRNGIKIKKTTQREHRSKEQQEVTCVRL